MDELEKKINTEIDTILANLSGGPAFADALRQIVKCADEFDKEAVLGYIENYKNNLKAKTSSQLIADGIIVNLDALAQAVRKTVPDENAWKRPANGNIAPKPKYDGEFLTCHTMVGKRNICIPVPVVQFSPAKLPQAKMRVILN